MPEGKSELEMKADEIKRDLDLALSNVASIMEQAHKSGFEISFSIPPVFDTKGNHTGKYRVDGISLIKRF